MSTVVGYEYRAAESARLAAAAELARRRMEQARLRAERAAAVHRETLSLARASDRLFGEQLQAQGEALRQGQAQMARLSERARNMGVRLEAVQSHLETSRQELAQARSELRLHMDELASLEQAAAVEAAALRASLAEAEGTLGQVDRLTGAAGDQIADLEEAGAAGERFAQLQTELEARLRQVEDGIRFATQRADLTPAALVTLQAMELNGYQLRDTLGRDEMIVYFQKEGEQRQIAVRLAPLASTGGEERWDLLAESFHMRGEECLGELDDFETAAEELAPRALRRNGTQIYPKDERSADPRQRGRLPKPASRVAPRARVEPAAEKQKHG